MSLFKSVKTRFVVWVWNHTPNCAEMSRLASRSLDGTVSLKRRVQMRLHRLICAWCRRYGHQMAFLRSVARKQEQREEFLPAQKLPAAARDRIKRRLQAPNPRP